MDHRRPWNALTHSRIPFIPLLVIAVLAAAGGASAQQDAFCICLDPTDPNTCGGNAVIPVGVPTPIWLCLLEPSGDQVLAWEARVTDDRGADTISGEWCLNGGLDVDSVPGNFVVGSCPAPWQPNAAGVITFASMMVRVLDDGVPVSFFVGPIPGSISFPQGVPGYVHTLGFNTPATVCSGDFDEPVFSINGVVAADVDTWGAIKSAYSAGPSAGR
ncbi:MAG: hypothetical protein Q7W56_00395 [Candidatus Latescibacteria bacterium]|nr:hypothetical protein [Candidatus Latescibacterota bacterium]